MKKNRKWFIQHPFFLLIGKKWMLAWLLAVWMYMPASAWGQHQKVSIQVKNATVPSVLQEIKKQTNLNFVYSAEQVDALPNVSMQVKQGTVEEVLRQIFKDSGLEYRFEAESIIIRKPRMTQQQTLMKKELRGTVKDAQGNPLPGVTVILKGTTVGVVTDADGKYQLRLPEVKDLVLIFSFVGMKTQEIAYTGQMEINVTLHEEAAEMDEVVVTGIFNKNKQTNTGAISVITEKEIKHYGNRNIIETLSNIDPALQILTNNDWGSNPNRTPEIQIRGAASLPDVESLQNDVRADINSPLMIIDGFETDLQRVLDMDIEEIASVSILKDAAATALYGSRGSNGVIVVTTKVPEAGKLRIGYVGTLNLEFPDLSDYHLLNATEKLELERISGFYNADRADSDISLKMRYNKLLQDVNRGVNTYWLSKPLRVGVGHRHNLKLEGGDQTFRYSTSLQYNDIEGVMKKSFRKVFNGTINLSYSKEKFIFRNYLSISVNKSSESPYGVFSEYTKLNPYWTNLDEKGKIRKFFDETNFYGTQRPVNPMYNATLNVINTTNQVGITDNLNIEWRPLECLKAEVKFGITYNTSHGDDFKPRDHTDFSQYTENDVMRKGKYIYDTFNGTEYTFSGALNYNNTWREKHQLTGGLFFELSDNRSKKYSFSVEGFSHESLDFLSMALQYEKNAKPDGEEIRSRRVGFVGNLNYSFSNRYILDASFRIDGDSKYGLNRRFAPFWSVGIAWNLHNENFLENVNFIDRLKLRGAVGVTGANNFNAYDAIATYVYYVEDRYKEWMGNYQNILDNPDLSWQKTWKYNVGLELNVLKNRLNFIADLYYERTDGLVSKMDLKPSNGFSNYAANIGQIENKGFELKANAFILRNTEKNLYWSITAGIVHNRDKIVSLSEDIKKVMKELESQEGSIPNRIWREGDSQNDIYAVPSLGIDPSTGKELFLTKDGDVTYTWNAADRIKVGNSLPKFHGNLNTNFQFGGWECSISFAYRWGGQIYNSTLINRVENANKRFNVDKRVYEDRWKKPGDETFFKGINETSSTRYTSRFVQNESTWECKNIQLSYRFSDLKFLRLSSLTLTLNTAEPFRTSTIRQERGIQYPFSRQFSFILRANF